MQRAYFSGDALADTHDNLLLVNVDGRAGALAARLLGAARTAAKALHIDPSRLGSLRGADAPDVAIAEVEAEHPGLAVLASLARQGQIEEVQPLAPVAEGSVAPAFAGDPLGVHLALASSLIVRDPERIGQSILRGTNLVKLRSGQRLDRLRREIAEDVSMRAEAVPVRYLMAQPSRSRQASREPVDPKGEAARTVGWSFDAIHWPAARADPSYREPTEVKVAVLDTGIDLDHPLFAGRVKRYDFSYPGLNVVSGPKDIVGHGTHVAGTIAAGLDARTGIRGLCECPLHVWKIFSDEPTLIHSVGEYRFVVDPRLYLRALSECVDAELDVVNLSIGGTGAPSEEERMLFNALQSSGALLVAAMGNSRQLGSPKMYPAAHVDVVAVGATDPLDRVATFSNRGPHITVCAPGTAIWSTLPITEGWSGFKVEHEGSRPRPGRKIPRGTWFDAWDGTSMATPHVTAALAIHMAVYGKCGIDQVIAALRHTSDATPTMTGGGHAFHQDYGHGRLNFYNLVTNRPGVGKQGNVPDSQQAARGRNP